MSDQPTTTPDDDDDPVQHHCRTCDRGELIYGHCIDIDGEYWHDCHATRQDG